MTGREDAIRRLSTAAFGQSHRLELMLVIARSESGVISLSEAAGEIPGVAMSSLQRPFESLVACGLLDPLPRGESRHRYYLRNDSAAWAWCAELAASVEAALAIER